jgi:hypothetical protein
MPKVTIYVPDELKARMDRAGEHVNWSAAAQRVFELELKSTEWKMAENPSEQTVARLRASKEAYEDRISADGRAFGVLWARKGAGFDQLKRVAETDWSLSYSDPLPVVLESVIFDEEEDRNHRWELWKELVETWSTDGREHHPEREEPSDIWVHGFVEGAGEIWDEVADKI